MFSNPTLEGPTPIIHLLVLAPISASGKSQSPKAVPRPSNPSAFPLRLLIILNPPNISVTPPNAPDNSLSIPPIISLNNAPIN